MKKHAIAVLAMMAVFAAYCAPANPVKVKNNFPRVPAQALRSLKATIGKPFRSGWVFIDGKYIEPPYKVERYGTALRINGNQVTGEIVPWEEFIKTQDGVKMTKSEAPAADPTAAAPEPEPEPEPEEDDSWENSLDDLFDDDPAPKKTAKKKTAGYKPRPKKPTVTVTYSFDGEFVHNDKSKALLARINAARTKLDSHLRSGGLCYFSAYYSGVRVDGRAAKEAMAKLPDLMKQSTSAEGLAQAIRSNGITYLSAPFINDLFKNKVDYIRLLQRNKSDSQREAWGF